MADDPQSLYATKAFLKLQAQWNKRLKASGFEDIEHLNHNGSQNTPFLKGHAIRVAKRYNASRADYYRLAGQFAEDTESPIACALTVQQRQAWRMHADGQSLDDIRRVVLKNDRPYWGAKAFVKKIRKQFLLWCRDEAWRDKQDSLHEQEGGLDAWLASLDDPKGHV